MDMENSDASYLLIFVHYGCDDPAMYYVEENEVPVNVLTFIRRRGNSDKNPIFEDWLWEEDENSDERIHTLNQINTGSALPPGKVTIHVCYCY